MSALAFKPRKEGREMRQLFTYIMATYALANAMEGSRMVICSKCQWR